MTRKQEIEIIMDKLVQDTLRVIKDYPTLAVDRIIENGKQLQKYTNELETIEGHENT